MVDESLHVECNQCHFVLLYYHPSNFLDNTDTFVAKNTAVLKIGKITSTESAMRDSY